MSKLIKMQKRFAIVLVSLLLTMFYRTVALVRPSYKHGEGEQTSRVRESLLVRIPTPRRISEATARYYAAELNGSFPYVHLQHVSGEALSVPLAFADDVLEMNDVLGVAAISLTDPQSGTIGMSADPQQSNPLYLCYCDDDDDCGGCSDCTDCTD